jgi:hypothetical protein
MIILKLQENRIKKNAEYVLVKMFRDESPIMNQKHCATVLTAKSHDYLYFNKKVLIS